MKTPGFTAEDSLYHSSHHYQASITYTLAETESPGMNVLSTVVPEDQLMAAIFWDCPEVKNITWGWDEQSICTCNNPHPCKWCTDWGDSDTCRETCPHACEGKRCCFVDNSTTCCDGYRSMCECNPPTHVACGCDSLPDGDIIQSTIEHNAVDPAVVEFVLELGWHEQIHAYFNNWEWVTWWKGLNVPDGEGNSWDIWVEDNKIRDSVALWAHQVHNGQWLTFSKAKFFGKHCPVYILGNLDRLQPGDRVTFRWLKD